MKYRLSLAAERDLLRIFQTSLRVFGRIQAERYYQGLLVELKYITEFPEAAGPRRDLRNPSRFHRYASHVIIYSAVNDEVLVLRILHGHQDAPRHLG